MIPSPLLIVTDRHGSNRPLADTVRAALDGGARWIWFRDKDMEPAARRALALQLLTLAREAGGTLTIGGDAVLAAEIGADGVHLSMASLVPGAPNAPRNHAVIASEAKQSTEPGRSTSTAGLLRFARNDGGGRVEPAVLIGLSAHNVGEVKTAAAAGLGYVTLSPIFPTASKPGYGPALGLDGLREAAGIGLPVVALGGITPENAGACREAGAAGVAVMGGIMRARDPAAATRKLLAALDAT